MTGEPQTPPDTDAAGTARARWWARLEALKIELAAIYLEGAFDRAEQLTLQIDELERHGATRGWAAPQVNAPGRRSR